ncbi:hypothetical protein CcCBS67573_g04502 [Chytriomyces confervae]|uniref:Riboflavin synthase n=1 Tax=Chytriomyces confervae TaxID=246404 RepID=A0A507FDC0_9FUNG|nr:hypothetical protein CcCBS67573_g04502 [Chytriomyces confervae]
MVFTGIVEHMGTISAIVEVDNTWGGGSGLSMTFVDSKPILDDVKIGDSIMVSGICLTVTEFDDTREWFKVGFAPETSRRTNCGDWKVGDKVNLERAMNASTRYGGHVVQGHVDTTVTIVSVKPDPPNSLIFTFKVAPIASVDGGEQDPMLYIIAKGYVCLNGASLTVINVDRNERTFSIMLIAHSQSHLNLPLIPIGGRVNLEVDEIGKYIESVVRGFVEQKPEDGDGIFGNLIKQMVSKAVDEKLKALGVLPPK